MNKIDLLDDRFTNLYEEIKSCLDDDQQEEVFLFEHKKDRILTRTAIIEWDVDEFLILQSHYWNEEGEVSTIRLPALAVKFMCTDLLTRSINATSYLVTTDSEQQLKHFGWQSE